MVKSGDASEAPKPLPTPLVVQPSTHVPLKEACRLTGLKEVTMLVLGDEDVIECIRDENNERRFSRASLAMYLYLKQQNAANRTYRNSGKKMAEQIRRAHRGQR